MKRLKGTIVSDKMDKTVIVEVVTLKKHPKYERRFTVSKRYKAHNPENAHKVGESVIIEETRPMSKEKRWKIL
jgi:small subunit ribosomal protein S17